MQTESKHRLFINGEELAAQLTGSPSAHLRLPGLPAGDDLDKTLVTWLYGYLLKERSQLDLKTKLLCIVAMCTATGKTEMLGEWIEAARRGGCARSEVQETIVTMLVYAGWPSAKAGLDLMADRWPLEEACEGAQR